VKHNNMPGSLYFVNAADGTDLWNIDVTWSLPRNHRERGYARHTWQAQVVDRTVDPGKELLLVDLRAGTF
jgi:hypothetical protein